jgi:NadR type nicotinamide-nucleotide adenylyltransferase
MSAILPTTGHINLIKFAAECANSVHVLVSETKNEPSKVQERIAALSLDFKSTSSVNFILHYDPDAPQFPSSDDDFDFWEYWKNTLYVAPPAASDVLIGSQEYIIPFAKHLGCSFIVYDIGRQINSARGTECRQNIGKHFDKITSAFQQKLNTRVVFFGPESCGKTTTAKLFTGRGKGTFVPEWAREYLEMPRIGPKVTDEKMKAIAIAQHALEKHAEKNLVSKPFTFFDTDIISTWGYMKLWDKTFSLRTNHVINDIIMRDFVNKDIYILMSDRIPFEPDILRYGGNKRESNCEYWKNILDIFSLPYYEVKSTDKTSQLYEIAEVCENIQLEKYKSFSEFGRPLQ